MTKPDPGKAILLTAPEGLGYPPGGPYGPKDAPCRIPGCDYNHPPKKETPDAR